ncbi:Por secretion system C-terminal sorting domain-containing protein [Formosa sp. Hel1_31_208]|uniref:T9SS type A sorting domain-containing protein n=1 Tax=Formosa sp. Hel1_31_208 TaxID=1798225 RepID=UPI00087B5EF2|nr:T9SS type A sorting domain-containing protein [Formosa sp. Hel1_31_208]SDS28393.1 Por secretion system C-terminal sorting domain-containing protein [Formosa sp. Hel1_31_208]
MKKITILIVLLCNFTFAQNPTSYLDVSTENSVVISNTDNPEAPMEISENSQLQIIGTYTTLGDFNAAVIANCSDTTLSSEDFTNGPVGITDCGVSVSSAGDGCFVAGELAAGFSVEASNSTTIINIPPGVIGNIDSLIGATTFAEYTIINFSPDVYSVAMDIWENNDPTTVVRVFGVAGVLIDTFNVNTPVNSQTFFGVISDEPITAIELEGLNGSGELFGNFLFGADCMLLSVEDNLQELISIYPNPIEDTLFLNVPSFITISDVKIYDALGKSISVNIRNNQIDVSALNSGLYFMKINALQGTLTKKFVKK